VTAGVYLSLMLQNPALQQNAIALEEVPFLLTKSYSKPLDMTVNVSG